MVQTAASRIGLPAGSQIPGPAGLKELCRQRYQALREQVVSSLITGEWLIAEGEARGLTASDSEIKHRTERVWKKEFTSKAKYMQYLAYTGETVADRLFRSKIKVFSEKIERQLAATGGRALGEFAAGFPRKWAAKTKCNRGYVIYDCREYRGHVPPEARLL